MHYNYKKSIKRFVVVALSFTLLATHIANAWSQLPCAYKCKHSHSIKNQSDNHHKHHDNLSPDPVSTSPTFLNKSNGDCDSCDNCTDYYNDLFNITTTLESTEITTKIFRSVNNEYKSSSFNRIPDPYRTPPA